MDKAITDINVEIKTETFDLAIAWNWHLDKEFIDEITLECQKQGITYYFITGFNREETIAKLTEKKIKFNFYFDRASDLDAEFKKLMPLIRSQGTKIIADPEHAEKVANKAVMHFKLLSRGINVPYSIIVSNFEYNPQLDEEIKRLSSPFIIKLANEGGGTGVMLDAKAFSDLQRAKQQFGEGVYLLQECIDPTILNGKRAWFRVYYVFGKVIPCWWDNVTKLSDEMTPNGMDFLGLTPLREITLKIAKLCQLEFFSTEIALTNNKKFVVVDYVNDQCDMRKKSLYYDGVPDSVVKEIVQQLVRAIKKMVKK